MKERRGKGNELRKDNGKIKKEHKENRQNNMILKKLRTRKRKEKKKTS